MSRRRGPTGTGLIALALHGRLGNQLFGFATARALLGPGVAVPIDAISVHREELAAALQPGEIRLLTQTELIGFGRPPRIPIGNGGLRLAQSGLIRGFERARTTPLGRRLLGDRQFTEGWGSLRFNPATAEVRGPVLLDGFFQNERYFRDCADTVVDALRPPTPAGLDAIEAVRRAGADGRPTVAVVIRAGADYVGYRWALPFEWYRRGVALVADRLGAVTIVTFSDLPVPAQAAVDALRDFGSGFAVGGLSPLDQLHVIAHCDHAVIANSTFAWWGAWLGDHRRGFPADRTVVAPDPWIHADDEIVPDRWTTLARR